ncbi:MAG: nucleoside hydrolase [Sedimentisphaerales bacterium]
MKINKMASILILLILPLNNIYANTTEPENKVPVIYCTDLFHPHVDPDDHFDIACLYAIKEIEIKGIILDQGEKQKEKPGSIPISQLNYITKRNVPYAIGLANKLESAEDNGLKQLKEYQQGVELILTTLRTSKKPVTIISVGSLRDVAASYNRSPNLFRTKINKLFIFIGEASLKGHVEYNVGLDKNAYIRIMNSGLPIYWVPCFDGGLWQNNGRASYWRASHKDLLKNVSNGVMNYFVYALLRKNEVNPVQYLNRESNREDREKVLLMNRNLWCSAVFPFVAGRRFVSQGNRVIPIPGNAAYNNKQKVIPFTFNEVSAFVDEQGNVLYEHTSRARKINRFQVIDKETYSAVMTSITAQLLFEFDH